MLLVIAPSGGGAEDEKCIHTKADVLGVTKSSLIRSSVTRQKMCRFSGAIREKVCKALPSPISPLLQIH
jgi:hypothetical protein